jgi:hypothetical protein
MAGWGAPAALLSGHIWWNWADDFPFLEKYQ